MNRTVIITGLVWTGSRRNFGPLTLFVALRLRCSEADAWDKLKNAAPGPTALRLTCKDGEPVGDLWAALRELGASVCLPTVRFQSEGYC